MKKKKKKKRKRKKEKRDSEKTQTPVTDDRERSRCATLTRENAVAEFRSLVRIENSPHDKRHHDSLADFVDGSKCTSGAAARVGPIARL